MAGENNSRVSVRSRRKGHCMNTKKGAVKVGRPFTANKAIVVHDHVLIISGKKKIVKIDGERWFDILGGLMLGAGIAALSIMIPILLGGY